MRRKKKASTPPITKSHFCAFVNLCALYGIDDFLHKLSDVVALPSKHFELLYIAPVRQLVTNIQHTPGYFDSSKSLIEEKLQSVLSGMRYRENFIMPEGIQPEDINHKKDLWRYSTFFSLMLYDLGPSISNYSIVIKSNDVITTHKKFFGLNVLEGTEITYVPSVPDVRASSLLYANLVFPPAAIGWIEEDREAFNNSISSILDPSHDHVFSKIIKKAYRLDSVTSAPPPSVSHNFSNIAPEIKSVVRTQPTGKQIGTAFFQWAIDQVQNSGGADNDFILFLDGGDIALKAPEIFSKYAEEHNYDWKTVKNGFNKLSLHIQHSEHGKNSDFHKLPNSKGVVGTWLVISSEKFSKRTAMDLPKEDFITWLNGTVKKQPAVGSNDDPIYFSTDKYVYLICPRVFTHYLEKTSGDSALYKNVEQQLLSLGLHELNDQKDFFEIPLSEKRVSALKFQKSKLNLS